jgi:hypothetical protein|nr:hypothetical protein [Neorhizobium tomejilense]
MDHRDLDIDRKMLVASVLESLMRARQAAYQASLEIPEMRPTFDATEKAYADAVETFKARYVSVFDEERYVDQQVARGDRYHTFVRENLQRGPKP